MKLQQTGAYRMELANAIRRGNDLKCTIGAKETAAKLLKRIADTRGREYAISVGKEANRSLKTKLYDWQAI